MQTQFTASEVGKHHRTIATIPWRKIYTTNYDNVVEKSCEAEGIRCTSITTSVNIYDVPKDHMLCVHLNGYIHKLGREALQSELKLTDTSYLTASLMHSPWMGSLRQDMRFARAVVFLGYSLYDIDIKKILFESEALKEKCFFVMPSASLILKKRIEKFGTITAYTGKDFARVVNKKRLTFVPREKSSFTALAIRD